MLRIPIQYRRYPVLTLGVLLSMVVSASPAPDVQVPCCYGRAGNIDMDVNNVTDIADLTVLIDHLFISLQPLNCPDEGNIDGDINGVVDIADLTFLIDHLFISLVETSPCFCDSSIAIPTVLLGNWTFQSATVNGIPVSLAEALVWEPATASEIMTIAQTGLFVLAQFDNLSGPVFFETGEICITGETAVVTLTDDADGQIIPPEVSVVIWVVNGNSLELTFLQSSGNAVFIATR